MPKDSAVNQPKQKLLIPYRVAIALQEDGWICRSDITWFKPNSMPSSVKDRLSCTTERIFHFVKSRKYWYDLDSIRVEHQNPMEMGKYFSENRTQKAKRFRRRESQFQTVPTESPHRASKDVIGRYEGKRKQPPSPHGLKRWERGKNVWEERFAPLGKNPGDVARIGERIGVDSKAGGWGRPRAGLDMPHGDHPIGKNPSDFWEINTQPFPDAHFSVYPEEICVKPILSSCPPDGIVLDPFAGSFTTAKVARDLDRNSISIEIQPKYLELAKKRLRIGEQLQLDTGITDYEIVEFKK